MPKIQLLPERVINIIAAGEVVERPASVVKELVENALDAEARQIFITVGNGGRDLITVLDNGAGMDEEDVRHAAQRHATSKLRDEQGLEAIGSLGFRGEALASIAAVSRFELISCNDESASAVRIALEGGREQSVGKAGFPRGTKVTVEDLFFNTPARRKFLRSTSTEFQHIQTFVTQVALAHPRVHFRLTHNRKVVSNLTPSEFLGERAYQLFGEEFAEGMVAVAAAEGTVGFDGLVSSPSYSKSSRRWQYLFINGRPIRNVGVNHGIYQAYRTLLMKDRHPAYVLNLRIDPREVDVNVHPAKSEVRLRNPQLVHTVVADKLHKALLDSSRRRAFAGGQADRPSAARRPMPDAAPADGQVELALTDAQPAGPSTAGFLPMPRAQELWSASATYPAVSDSPSGAAAVRDSEVPASSALLDNPFQGEGFHFQPLSGRVDAALIPGAVPDTSWSSAVLGQLHRTYLLVQRKEQLVIVDQHAAHERILFEQFRKQFYESGLVTERYLLPLTLELSAQNALLLEQYLPQWNKMGFEIEPFGKSSYLVRQVPALLSGKDVKQLILEVLDELALFGQSGKLEEVINEILERVACHGAIRAGMHLSQEEMEALVAQLEQLDINLYCPHGRPVWVEFSLRELEKRFKRIV
ncbi:MAG: DNA mismatch repair endonuclease MutL [SAR324 cluster bacterium]|nr:DNA mismatch repair endonuclease MutL [SAR324 cluster bacterium]